MPPLTVTGERVAFASGPLELGGFLAAPAGRGPFPAVVWNHGSGSNPHPRLSPIAAFWVAQGVAFFEPHRRGFGLSAAAGPDQVTVRRRLLAGGTTGHGRGL